MSDIFNYDPVLVLSAILKRNGSLMKTPHGFVALASPGCDSMIVEYGMGMGENYIGRQLSTGDGVTGCVLVTGQPQLISNYSAWQGKFRGLLPHNRDRVDTVAGTPVWRNGTIVAVLVFIFEAKVLCPQSDGIGWLRQISATTTRVLRQLESVSSHPLLDIAS